MRGYPENNTLDHHAPHNASNDGGRDHFIVFQLSIKCLGIFKNRFLVIFVLNLIVKVMD